MKQIDPTIFEFPVSGLNLANGRLSDQLTPNEPTLLVFLRHFG